MPQNVTVAQLETLLNGLLENEERLPYSFWLDDVELADEMGQHMLKHKAPLLPLPPPQRIRAMGQGKTLLAPCVLCGQGVVHRRNSCAGMGM